MADELYFEDINVGDKIATLEKGPIPKLQMVKYSGASGDFNPLHSDDDVGKMAGLGGLISHGMLIMGFAGQTITNWIPKKNLRKFGVRFAAMTFPNEVITSNGEVLEKKQENGENIVVCSIILTGQDGSVKIKGSFEVALPSKG